MTTTEEAARSALRERLGAGARFDAEAAPAEALDWARRGTAYFARLLNSLADKDLTAPSTVGGVSRQQIILRVCYQARLLADTIAWVREGHEERLLWPLEVDPVKISEGRSLPPRALRHLFEHTAIHLNVEWRDLDGDMWARGVDDKNGNTILMCDTPKLRARVIWAAALELGAGGRLRDLPEKLVRSLDYRFPSDI